MLKPSHYKPLLYKEIPMYIGKKIKEVRKLRNMTLVQLSEKSGVQVATLSRIENEKMTGRLESHIAIAAALGVDVTQLYSGLVESENHVHLKKGKDQKDIFIHSDKASYEILTTNVLKKRMMPALVRIEAAGTTQMEENTLGTEKFLYCLEGTIEVYIGKDTYTLSKGNSLYFDASLPHWLENKGKSVVKLISVVTPSTL